MSVTVNMLGNVLLGRDVLFWKLARNVRQRRGIWVGVNRAFGGFEDGGGGLWIRWDG